MKKLTFFLLLSGCLLAIWNCGNKPSDQTKKDDSSMVEKTKPPMKLISIADIVLQAKIRGASPKTADSTLLREIYVLHELDGNLRFQIDKINLPVGNQKTPSGSFEPMSSRMSYEPGCCVCGIDCCWTCTDSLGDRTAAGIRELQEVFLSSKKSGETALKPLDDIEGLKLFNLNTRKPDGLYTLTIKTSLSYKPISVQIEIKDKHFVMPKFGKP